MKKKGVNICFSVNEMFNIQTTEKVLPMKLGDFLREMNNNTYNYLVGRNGETLQSSGGWNETENKLYFSIQLLMSWNLYENKSWPNFCWKLHKQAWRGWHEWYTSKRISERSGWGESVFFLNFCIFFCPIK